MKNIFQAIRHWQRSKSAAKALKRLDDRVLTDIGIAHGAICKAVLRG